MRFAIITLFFGLMVVDHKILTNNLVQCQRILIPYCAVLVNQGRFLLFSISLCVYNIFLKLKIAL